LFELMGEARHGVIAVRLDYGFGRYLFTPGTGLPADPADPMSGAAPIPHEVGITALFVTFYVCAHDTGFLSKFVEFESLPAFLLREVLRRPIGTPTMPYLASDATQRWHVGQ